MSSRANPFGDLDDFAPKAKAAAKPVEPAQIEQLAAEHGFPSRRAAPEARAPRKAANTTKAPTAVRRYTTGRNRQLNLKASDDTIARFYRLADERQVALAELFELAVEALEAASPQQAAR